ncbi:MAG: hypothetical protein JWO08_1137 [Verrucomicrobiaceae bacterium]|nr:hypothetical protein [Verrucomicrobiaceae bacterium]
MTFTSSINKAANPREQIVDGPKSNVMLSRVAASLYWMSRYLERAENIARLLDVNLQLLLDFGKVSEEALKQHWIPVLRASGEEDMFFQVYGTADSRSVVEFLTFSEQNTNSICSCIYAARENGRQVRDQISLEMWEVLNAAYLFLKESDVDKVWARGATEFFDQVKNFSHLFQGLTDSTFSRNEGYEFIQFGKFLERADKTSRILDIKYHMLLPKVTDVGGAVDTAQWQAVLRSTSSLEAYRRYYVAEIVPWKVAMFLVFSESFPRSIRYCIERVGEFVHLITDTPSGQYRTEGERRFGKFLQQTRFTTPDEVLREGLHEFLERVQKELLAVADHMFDSFMYHPPVDMAAEIRLHQQEQQQQQVRAPEPPQPHRNGR